MAIKLPPMNNMSEEERRRMLQAKQPGSMFDEAPSEKLAAGAQSATQQYASERPLPPGQAGVGVKAAAAGVRGPGYTQDTGAKGMESPVATQPGATPKPKPESKGSIFDTDAEGEKAAFAQELEAQRAKAMQQAEARAGLGGMGLSGATGQLVSDIGRQQQRAGQLAMGEFERAQSAAQFQDIQRQASIWDMEQASNEDIDGDGFRGNPDVGEKPGDPESGQITDEQMQFLNQLQPQDPSIFDPDTGPGTRQEPYGISLESRQDLARRGFQLRPVQGGLHGNDAYVDQYGNYYMVVQ